MDPIKNRILFWFAIAWVLAIPGHTAAKALQNNGAEITVRNLYREVVLRAPSGLLSSANRRIFEPYLSRSLRRKMGLADACEKDWIRQNPEQAEKAPFGWSEFGLFSGENERTSPGDFHIESPRKDDDGSFHIDVTFTYRPVDGKGSWRVTDRVIREDGRFVVDEVFFPKEEGEGAFTLSDRLSEGCDGPHWVGEHRP
jgi:hypothetical protein